MLENGTSSFFHYDALGSTHQLTDSSQTVTDTYRYNGWGETVARTGTTKNPHTFVGRERYYGVPDAMLYLLGLRYYAFAAGRFLAGDPAGVWPNLYQYVRGRATMDTDSSGRWSDKLHWDMTHDCAMRAMARGPILGGGGARMKQMGFLAAYAADSSRLTDMFWSTLSAENWHIHFNWPEGSNSRRRWFHEHWAEALQWGRKGSRLNGCCQTAAQILGKGLHALQDEYAHMLRPWEHMDDANEPMVDEKEWDPRTWTSGPLVVWRKLPEWKRKLVYRDLKWVVGQPVLANTRKFSWVRSARSKRWNNAEWETSYYIKKFLEQTNCGT